MFNGIFMRADFEFLPGELIDAQMRDGGPGEQASVLVLYFSDEAHLTAFRDKMRELDNQGIEDFEFHCDFLHFTHRFHIDECGVSSQLYED